MSLRNSHALVTVGYEADYPLLRLQARSMALRLPHELFDEIVVIDNSRFGFGPARRRALTRDFGGLAPAVRVLRPADLGKVPRGTYGWTAQQVLKLQVSRSLNADRYLLVDAKNILVNEPPAQFLEDADARPRVRAYSYVDHPLRPALERTLAFLNLPPNGHVEHFTATVTPFVLQTDVVRNLLAYLEASSRSVVETFVSERLTEFFLYGAWTIARGTPLDVAFDLSLERCPNVWPKDGATEVEAEIRESRKSHAPFFTVHQRALARFDVHCRDQIAMFWFDAGLFRNIEDARSALDACRRTYMTAGRKWSKRPRFFVG